jgi:hypothetical protein
MRETSVVDDENGREMRAEIISLSGLRAIFLAFHFTTRAMRAISLSTTPFLP